MVIALVVVIIMVVSSNLFRKVGLSVGNYRGEDTPYNLGLCAFIAVISIIYYYFIQVSLMELLYLTVIWLTGFIDDRFGTKYPKGLKGHIGLFVKKGKISTGLLKLVSTVTVAFLVTISISQNSVIEQISILLLLIVTPHVMNLFDTRPLRVWKVMLIHSFIFLPLLFRLSLNMQFTILFLILAFLYFEGTRRGMLGDNGATFLGGALSLLAINQLSVPLQYIFIATYFLIVFITEKISLSKWIDSRPILRKIDRWGVS